jgi:transgelin
LSNASARDADGVRLVNKAALPGVRAKQSNMPFVQRENISHFVRACQMPPLSLPDHDIFLTDDLYDAKDPAQVLQCIVAFSRRANAVNPSDIPRAIGAKSKASFVTPQLSGTSQGAYSRPAMPPPNRGRGSSNASESSATTWNPLAKGSYSGRISPTKNSGQMSQPGNVTSWSKKGDEGSSAPAWNIHQYGYMGGASQGNQGISFGARRQITSASPPVPSLAEKERRRREEEKEAERQRMEAEAAGQKRRLELEAEEEKSRFEEDQRWQEETRRLKEKETEEAEAEKRRWDEEQRRWKIEEEARLREERDTEARRIQECNRQRGNSDARLRGQFLSQYQAEQDNNPSDLPSEASRSTSESQRIQDLERQLELAKERERRYQLERQERLKNNQPSGGRPPREQMPSHSPDQRRPQVPAKNGHEDDWQESEREYLQKEWQNRNDTELQPQPSPPYAPKPTSAEPVPLSQVSTGNEKSRPLPHPRPLPDPAAYAPNLNRTDRYLSSNPAPAPVQPQSHRPADYSTTTEVDLENQRRKESQAKTKAGGWASKSLLEREMERERERQREWEEAQKQTTKASRDNQQGAGPGQSWDVHQYGYMGGDSQNRGGPGLGVGGARRPIIGPRPPP